MAHLHTESGQVDFIADTYIVCENKVLLRIHDKYKIWLSVGGHIELNENPNEAAIREVKEEVGLDITLYSGNQLYFQNTEVQTELIPPVFMNIHVINENHRHISMIYFGISKNTELILDTEKEVSPGCKWFTIEELDNPQYNIKPDIIFYAKEALKRLAA